MLPRALLRGVGLRYGGCEYSYGFLAWGRSSVFRTSLAYASVSSGDSTKRSLGMRMSPRKS